MLNVFFFFSSRRRHTRWPRDWSSDVCSSDLLWRAYVPPNVTQYIRQFSDWGSTKIERFRSAGYDVVILDEGIEKEISGRDVRTAIREGREWQSLVPAGVARVIERLERAPALSTS